MKQTNKTPTSVDFQNIPTALEILRRAKNKTGPRQETAKASPKREPPEKKLGRRYSPQRGLSINNMGASLLSFDLDTGVGGHLRDKTKIPINPVCIRI